MTVDLFNADAVEWARDYSGEPFHALLCDAPYEMNFMGKGWDASGVAFDPETWKAFARVLYPGAFLMVFAGTINDDLISCAMREAGLRKFHKMAGWVFGSGFPKASRIDTQIDKAAGAEREVIGRADVGPDMTGGNYERSNGRQIKDITAPATDLARAFAGHRYGLQALKPALETVLIFQKPYEGRPVDNITQTGAGALNVDGGRIASSDGYEKQWDKPVHTNVSANAGTGKGTDYIGGTTREADLSAYKPSGRWPANFYLDAESARRLDEQSGHSVSAANVRHNGEYKSVAKGYETPHDTYGHSDSGGASRFFFRVAEQLDDADPVRYCAKASRSERDAGLDGFEAKTVPQEYGLSDSDGLRAPHKNSPQRNSHPTIKPLALTRYLATLLLPPAEYAPRRLFVPFAGVASECIGAMQAGWEQVTGVELTEEYIPIGQARVEYWQGQVQQKVMPL
jgi:hypothetical protein